jgi:nucleoid DNA-binding protein
MQEPVTLRLKQLSELTAIDSQYFKFEVEDILNSFYKVMFNELYKGNAILFEKIGKIQIKTPKPKKKYNFKTKRVYTPDPLPRLTITPTIGLLDYIRENEESIIKVKKSVGNKRLQHHGKHTKEYYEPKQKEEPIADDEILL